MKKSKRELEQELEDLNKIEKIMDIQDKVNSKKRELIKRKYTGIMSVMRFFKK